MNKFTSASLNELNSETIIQFIMKMLIFVRSYKSISVLKTQAWMQISNRFPDLYSEECLGGPYCVSRENHETGFIYNMN